MQFSFIKYTQPGWLFNIQPSRDISFSSCYYHPQYLPLQEEVSVDPDNSFETITAKYADIGYQAWNKGHLTWCNSEAKTLMQEMSSPSLKDEYTFLYKYWGKPWATYALLRRLVSLNNPFKEINAYSKASSKKRINPYVNTVDRSAYTIYNSKLIASAPLVAVIIPTLNRYVYLKDVLKDLEKQDYTHFEVIVVDQSTPFNEDFYKAFNVKLKVIHQKERLLWTARNNAVKATKAEYLLFFDDDSRVEPDWISQHLKCLDYFDCDISAGVSLAKVGMKIPANYSYFRWADQFDSGNAMVKRNLFTTIGLFDEQYNKQRMGDGEFGTRAYLNGYRSISNPYAARVHLKVSDGGLREMGSWDGFRPKKWFAPKPIPSVVFLYKKYYPKQLYRSVILLGVMLSNVSYRNKGNNKMLALSIALTVIKSPILLIQFLRARSIANKMLRKDNGIKLLQAPTPTLKGVER
ncbi:MAG: glycosyltransferase family 2 protein [Segetibacter sp.]|nr:glycosyltransferase family 2 protein [Segetibacter sp.]